MNEVVKNAIAWEAGKAEFTDDMRQHMILAVERPRSIPRLMLCNRKRLLLLAATLACVLILAGFTAVSIFNKLFETIPYHDVVVDYKGTSEYTELIDSLSPGEVATKIIDDQGASVLYKYFKGDSFDLECYGENAPDGGFMVIPSFDYDVPDIMRSVRTTDRTPDFYKEHGLFSFALTNQSYRLVEVTETDSRLFSLTYEIEDERRIVVQTVYGRFMDTSSGMEYRPMDITINGRTYMFLEIEDSDGITHELYCYLGDDKLALGIELFGLSKEELLLAAEHLVIYNEDANVPGAIPKLPDDIYSSNTDPLLRDSADEIVSAVGRVLKSGSESIAWSANGREIYVDPSEYAVYDVRITYTPQAWAEIMAGFQIPTPPLAPFNWSEEQQVSRVTVLYRKAELEVIRIEYEEDGSGFCELSIYPLDAYLPQTQLDATLITFIPGAGQIPDELVEIENIYYMKQQYGETGTWVYTAVLSNNAAWGYRFVKADAE